MNDLPPLRDMIAEHGLRADKGFGQHFLLDLNLTAKIASLCGDVSDAALIEVGPGPGGLTRPLLALGPQKMVVIEMDARFIPVLEQTGEAYETPFEIVEGDALKADEAALIGDGPAVIASNLPYNVGTPLLIKWLKANPLYWRRMVLMFQKEVADRVVAPVGSKAYGRLAILTAAVASARLALKAPARAFTPPPKVDSAVVVLDPLPEDKRFADLEALEIVTESAFGQRRKTLRKSLGIAAGKAGTSSESLLETAGIDPGARAETIDPNGFFRLAEAWRAAKG
ncbi:16S rRNA (adenine(1518)-N(6)/adenine(1519)-N(6))-dimethyltransferase RsmA [Hyphobacterium sp. HN65]|uniref:Ribosomal RNA small subunit methyltransferase A n=1 Tax=Hyphobacterium lacteum TaxID=3116575 RepID=A0ABU7LLG9_9PROT|nr:16S rRNA (adenine(1518)-N(6)/adenine(1519)-N(6))-dimethyltransferase RsmA [Hyphobacterium sp. HN65]MEE2524775.1 16S rRNA (adenine(1518)-N(6)/adenine(1519)-N(6))-dimethyltransferase RsmA [Hyphobacterium sp. HN65]